MGETIYERHEAEFVADVVEDRTGRGDWLRRECAVLYRTNAQSRSLEDSFRRLRRSSVYAVLVHDAGDLLVPGAERLWKLLERSRADGPIDRISVSGNTPALCRPIQRTFPLASCTMPFTVQDNPSP